ncbi:MULTISPECIES: Sec-independent protein translocase protein TatB [unclassified Amycolatopsis]|uniref:Sec-independent protein translocase protein TatB n=1 Tax=unclassified Amycolatopsis TaxID=2618356 RepID=UPI001FF11A23|nr:MULTISPECIES: Sec-independent protein translocase protein TatB [unclassified Amycolatopsis]UOZ10013.1 Sec-independent protein translocase protein TatB [Amycolatopsis sp. WQ 127309]WSJ76316.1 Sec-independent protein translocase protein TatB [Amycolatopsis sp. NBC_01307]WSK80078.1 Sec-independent protein translocase protein TatB [Amycolatopsis sp. NBC_01286]
MFDSVGWGEILVLIIAGLFILGPERLPEAASWMAKSVKKVRDFATGAKEQLREEMGPEFDQLRKPLEDLRGLRNFDPKRVVTQHLFDGDSDPLGLKGITNGGNGTNGTNGYTAAQTKPQPEPLKPGERPPIDPDAT